MWQDATKTAPAVICPTKFRVMRRGLRRRPDYEDLCTWNPPTTWRPKGYWTNRTGMVISSVVSWWNEEGGEE